MLKRKFLLFILVVALASTIFVVWASLPTQCRGDHIKDVDSDLCSYDLTAAGDLVNARVDCLQGETFDEVQKRCMYQPVSFFSAHDLKGWVIGFVGAGLILLTVIVTWFVRGIFIQGISIRKKVSPLRAEHLIYETHNRQFEGFRCGDWFNKDDFRQTGPWVAFEKLGAKFLRFEYETYAMNKPEGNGVFTVEVPLAQGEQAIRDSIIQRFPVIFDDFKVLRGMPLQEPLDKRERAIQKLSEYDPARAERLALKELESGTVNSSPSPAHDYSDQQQYDDIYEGDWGVDDSGAVAPTRPRYTRQKYARRRPAV